MSEAGKLAPIASFEAAGNLSTIGFTLPTEISFEQFEQICALFGTAHESMRWAIGDLIRQGEMIFGDDAFQAFERMGISEAMRNQYVRVAERIPMERRHMGLSWSHHRAVSSLEPEEQDTWLRRAEESGWSKYDLEEHLREQRATSTTAVRQHERRIGIADAAEVVYREAQPAEEGFLVPRDPMERLGAALGIVEVVDS